MKKENEVLDMLLKQYKFSQFKQLSKKDLGEVYRVQKNNDYMILKIQRNLTNYKREIGALKLLNNKQFQVPSMLDYGIITGENPVGYFIQEFWNGDTMDKEYPHYSTEKKKELLFKAGFLLGKMNTLFTEKELQESGLWKHAYKGIKEYKNYRWINLYRGQIQQWLKSIRFDGQESAHFFKESGHIIEAAFQGIDSNGTIGLLHRDFGFRNIMVENSHITGIIDFEYAVPGDIEFDLSKLFFSDLDFSTEENLRDIFFEGWEKSTGLRINWNRLWLYLAIQGMGAVQWVDRQADARVRLENKDYREKGVRILHEACLKLKRI